MDLGARGRRSPDNTAHPRNDHYRVLVGETGVPALLAPHFAGVPRVAACVDRLQEAVPVEADAEAVADGE